MKTLSFKLTMPNVGSWNRKWTSEDKLFYIIKKVSDDVYEKIMKDAKSEPIYKGAFVREQIGETPPMTSFYYSFGDGWGASVIVEKVDSKEANKRKRISKGFSGYDWMVDNIILYNEIRGSRK